MTETTRRLLLASAGALAITLAASPASAQKKYDEGATDTEIKIGNTNPYSGNASAYGVIGKTIEAYFKMVNDQGGINGRKINFITYDDGYAPPKTVEMVRKLEPIKPLVGKETLAQWMALATAGRVDELFESVMTNHYDPCYARSARRSYGPKVEEQTMELESLDRPALAEVVRRMTAGIND